MKTVYILFSSSWGDTFFCGAVDCEEKALRWVKESEEADKKCADKSNYHYREEEVK